MLGATQMPFYGKKKIMFKQCISVSSVEKEGRRGPCLGNYHVWATTSLVYGLTSYSACTLIFGLIAL